jgi:hypothetical protein
MLNRSVLTCLALVCGLGVAPLAAQTIVVGHKPARHASQAKHHKTAHTAHMVMPAVPVGKVVVRNKRKATLLDLSIAPLKTRHKARPVLIAHDLAMDQKAVAPLPKKQGCFFSIVGHFDDNAIVKVPRQNLCTDGAITLVD